MKNLSEASLKLPRAEASGRESQPVTEFLWTHNANWYEFPHESFLFFQRILYNLTRTPLDKNV